jgi:photosystem II stability/assembly factor-like uncharacterized protein
MKIFLHLKLPGLLLSLWLLVPGTIQAQDPIEPDQHTFGAIQARHIGPAVMSGRISCIDAIHNEPRTVYFGTAGGGIWKSENAGVTVEPVFDDYTQSIGALAIDQRHPDTLWAGTGESRTRNSVSVGTGIYKSVDGGDTWAYSGLGESERIGQIAIDPSNSQIVYAAALGTLWSDNSERGLFKTTDGGKTWEKILYVNQRTGCCDISLDPRNPDIIYAAMWEHRRLPWFFTSGGPGSGLYKSTDGGETWVKITEGLPGEELGRIAVDVSPANPDMVYALIEAKEQGGLYKSKDRGKTWKLVNDEAPVKERPFYFSCIVADPTDTGIVYKPGFQLYASHNGGKDFMTAPASPGRMHSDVHALWISPADNRFIYAGTDGGVYVSNDQAERWRMLANLPVSQFYHVAADNRSPYHIYGGLQDNGSWTGPSTSPGGIENSDWKNIGGGDGFYVFPDPHDEQVIYWQSQGGNINRYYRDSWEVKSIRPYGDEATGNLRFNWNTPVSFGPVSGAMYVGAQYLFRSTDQGDTWTRISPDLTTNDPQKQKQSESGGITIDNSTAENHCTIYTIGESPLDRQVIWAGTDDGNLQVTRDGGKNWQNVVHQIEGLPAHTWCSYIEPGKNDAATAIATFDGHRQGDKKPYVFITNDYGRTWKSLANNTIQGYCHVVLQDPVQPNLLFLGTEFGLYISINKGASWASFRGNMPPVSVRDMYLHPQTNDLLLATHGRGIVVVDDVTPLRHLTPGILHADLAFLPSRDNYIKHSGFKQNFAGDGAFVGSNPSQSTMITYYLKKRHIFGDMHLEVYNEQGEQTHTLPASKRKGINRVELKLRKDPPKIARANALAFGAMQGPSMKPGQYTIKIVKNEQVAQGTFNLEFDPDSRHTITDRQLRLEQVTQAYELIEELAFLVAQINDLSEQLQLKVKQNPKDKLLVPMESLKDSLTTIKDQLVYTGDASRLGAEEKIRGNLASLYGAMLNYLGRPTQSQMERLKYFRQKVKEYSDQTDLMIHQYLPGINARLKESGIETISRLTWEKFEEKGS